MHQLNIATAFLAGLASFISPCVLPLVPSYLSFLTGTSLEDLKTDTTAQTKRRVLTHALAFIAGFTVIFMAIGLLASVVGSVAFNNNKRIVEIVGGLLIVGLGLQMIGVIKIPALMMDKRMHIVSKKQSLVLSFFVGIGFAAGWSPCIGPILSAILYLATQEKMAQAAFLLFVYSMGLAVPFIITAAAVTQSLNALNRIKRFLPAIERGSGLILVATGIIVATNQFTRIAGFFYQFVPRPSL